MYIPLCWILEMKSKSTCLTYNYTIIGTGHYIEKLKRGVSAFPCAGFGTWHTIVLVLNTAGTWFTVTVINHCS